MSFAMKPAWMAFGLLLAVSAAPSRADELFGQNPYECAFAAKASRLDDDTRRANFAHCMMKVRDILQVLRVLDSMDYRVDYDLHRQVERKFNSGETWLARALLGDLITRREQDPARVKELQDEAMMVKEKEKISLCMSHPELKSPGRDEACRGVPGFHNSTGRVNLAVAKVTPAVPKITPAIPQATYATPAMIRDRYERQPLPRWAQPPAFCSDASITNPHLRAECP